MRAEHVSRRLSSHIALVQPSVGRWLVLVGIAGLSWALDYLALAASVAAVGSSVPWDVLSVGFLVVQASIALQIPPGGLGLAGTSLFAVLLTSGVEAAPAAASVLIYRSVTWLGLSVLGWAICALSVHTARESRTGEQELVAPGKPGDAAVKPIFAISIHAAGPIDDPEAVDLNPRSGTGGHGGSR